MCKWPFKKMLDALGHQAHTNGQHNKVPLHTHSDDYGFKQTENKKCWQAYEKMEPCALLVKESILNGADTGKDTVS